MRPYKRQAEKEKRRGGCRERQPGRNRAQRVRRGCSPAGPPVEKADFRRAGGAVGAAERRVEQVGGRRQEERKRGKAAKKQCPCFCGFLPKARANFVCGAKCQTIDILPRIFYDEGGTGAFQVLWRWISCTGKTLASGAPALSPATIRSTAQRQMSSTGWWMVVRGGVVRQARSVSS